ncbi:hypothetical protein MAUB1S_05213 [Mycolicibacterium aubagnense]
MSGMQGRSWALTANIGIQFVLILGAFIDVTIGIVGIIFRRRGCLSGICGTRSSVARTAVCCLASSDFSPNPAAFGY